MAENPPAQCPSMIRGIHLPDDQLGLMDHLGIHEFFYMGYCIGGCFAGKLMQRAPNRVVAAVLCQSVGHRPESKRCVRNHPSLSNTWMGTDLSIPLRLDARKRSQRISPG